MAICPGCGNQRFGGYGPCGQCGAPASGDVLPDPVDPRLMVTAGQPVSAPEDDFAQDHSRSYRLEEHRTRRSILQCPDCGQPVPAPGHYDHASGCPRARTAPSKEWPAIREQVIAFLARKAIRYLRRELPVPSIYIFRRRRKIA